MNGDFISHNLPVGKENASTQQILDAWALMKSDMQNVFDILRSKIQTSAILPSIGNNDVVVHNHVPCDDIFAQQYYYRRKPLSSSLCFASYLPYAGNLPIFLVRLL